VRHSASSASRKSSWTQLSAWTRSSKGYTPKSLILASQYKRHLVTHLTCLLSQIVSASQAGDIQFLDLRRPKETYLTIDAHRGSLTALGVHRHAPIIASGSAKQLIKVFSLKGEQLGIIKYHTSFMGQQIGPVSCLAFHPYQMLLAAGAAGSFVSLYTHHNTQLPR